MEFDGRTERGTNQVDDSESDVLRLLGWGEARIRLEIRRTRGIDWSESVVLCEIHETRRILMLAINVFKESGKEVIQLEFRGLLAVY